MARTRKFSQSLKDWNTLVSNYVKELRKNTEYSQEQFADLIGVERTVYLRKESGKSKFLASEVLYLIEYVTKYGRNVHPAPVEILDHFTKTIVK